MKNRIGSAREPSWTGAETGDDDIGNKDHGCRSAGFGIFDNLPIWMRRPPLFENRCNDKFFRETGAWISGSGRKRTGKARKLAKRQCRLLELMARNFDAFDSGTTAACHGA